MNFTRLEKINLSFCENVEKNFTNLPETLKSLSVFYCKNVNLDYLPNGLGYLTYIVIK